MQHILVEFAIYDPDQSGPRCLHCFTIFRAVGLKAFASGTWWQPTIPHMLAELKRAGGRFWLSGQLDLCGLLLMDLSKLLYTSVSAIKLGYFVGVMLKLSLGDST